MKSRVALVFLCLIIASVVGLSSLACASQPAAPSPAPTPAPSAKPSPTPAPSPAPPPAPAPAATVIKWKAQSQHPPTSYHCALHHQVFADLVKQKSQGRLQIEVFPPGAMVDAYQQFDALRKGVYEVSFSTGGYVRSEIPEGDIEQGLPATFSNQDDFLDFYMNYKGGRVYQLYAEAYKEKGGRLLKSAAPACYVVISKKAIKTAADMKGLKIRASGGYVDWVANLGGSPVELAPAEIITALERGVIDGVCWPNYTIGTNKAWDVAKYFLQPDIGFTAANITVNTKAYDALPDDLKKIVDEAGVEASYSFNKTSKDKTADILKEAVKDHAVQIITMSADEFAKLRKAAEDVWAKAGKANPRSAELVNLVKEYIAIKK